jgi:hypothetical protein
MSIEICKHGQAGAGRHKCAECAYEAGRLAGLAEAARRQQSSVSEARPNG